MSTKQAETWLRQFGAEYTSRNNLALEDYEKLYVDTIGVTRSALNEVFFANVPKDARILEVGTNVGNQLLLLQRAGFTNLHGVELQWEAIEIAQRKLGRANIVQGTALEIPFRDDWFDLEPVSNDFALTTEATERLLLSDTTSIWCKVI